MWKRAAQFAPFAAVRGYEEAVKETERKNEALYEPNYDDSEKHTLFDSIDQLLGGGFLHLNVGKEFFPGILQAGPEEIDYIIDNEEAVVIMLGGTDINRWVLLIVTSDVKLLLLG